MNNQQRTANSIRNEGVSPDFFTRFAIRNAVLSIQTTLLRALTSGPLSPEEQALVKWAKEGTVLLDALAAKAAEAVRAALAPK